MGIDVTISSAQCHPTVPESVKSIVSLIMCEGFVFDPVLVIKFFVAFLVLQSSH